MGWCSGTQIFDDVLDLVLANDEVDKKELVKVLIEALGNQDWDCEGDSKYWEHPLVRDVFKEMYPHWFVER